jgi:8-oxo-dGTP pyrophosphatase MutT (NUDIX family)
MGEASTKFLVSIKGVVAIDGRVLLLRNHRNEWDLPGGRIEHGESPEICVVREVAEETQLAVTAGPILISDLHVVPSTRKEVFVVTYGCYPPVDATVPVLSNEHVDFALFSRGEIDGVDLFPIYRRSVAAWFDRIGTDGRDSRPQRQQRS